MVYNVGVVQIDTREDKSDNFNRIEHLVFDLLKKDDVKLIALPEVFDVISKSKVLTKGEFIEKQEKTLAFLINLAGKYNVWVHGGSFREADEHSLKNFNTSLLISPDGEIQAKYQKLHLFDVNIENGPSVRESDAYVPGRDIVVAQTELGALGMSICYDLRFPELYRVLALMGAEVIFIPANFTHNTGILHWETLLKARAIENGCYVVASAQTGVKHNYISHGMSMVINPMGKIVNSAEYGECAFTARIDTDEVKHARKQIPSLQNRRTDVYSINYNSNKY